MVGESLDRVPDVLSGCCRQPINRTARPCGVEPQPGEETRACRGCDKLQAITAWCSNCGKEAPERVPFGEGAPTVFMKPALLDEYLASPLAEEHVAALLALPDPGPKANRSLRVQVLRATGCTWICNPEAAWHDVSLHRAGLQYLSYEEVRAYFKPVEDGRFIVSDMGEALRALRIQTGRWDWAETLSRPHAVDSLDGTLTQRHVEPAHLPRILLDTLLTAYRVGRLAGTPP